MKIKINLHKIAFGLLIIFILMLPVDSVLASPITGVSYINYIMILFIFFRALETIRNKKINVSVFSKNKALLVFPLLLIFSVFYRQSELYSSFWISTFLMTYAMFFCAVTDSYSEKEKKIIRKMIVFSSVSVIIAFLFMGDTGLKGRLRLTYGSRIMDPNYFAVCLCLINSLCFYNFLHNKKKIVNGVILILLLLIIFMTGSRGGLIANFVSLITLFLVSDIKFKNKIIFIFCIPIVLLIFGSILSQFVPESVMERYTSEYNEKSQGAGRYEIWKYGLKVYSDSDTFRFFFGTGIGTFQYVVNYGGHVAHNTFIQTLLEGGLLGEIILLIIIGKSFMSLYKDKNFVVLAALIGLVVGAISLDFLNSRNLWFCLILCYSKINITKYDNDKRELIYENTN